MGHSSESFVFTVFLGTDAHQRAEQFRRNQSRSQKGKQVYLNTLAVYAVNFYLRCLGLETDWNASDSFDPVMQALMDVADLEVKNLGKLECRAVLPKRQLMVIPPEVRSDRIGYVAVGMNESLTEATLLGFAETASVEEIPLSELRSLAEFPTYLHQLQQALKPTVAEVLTPLSTNLSQWLQDIFETGWQSVEAVLGAKSKKLAFNLRNHSQSIETGVKRAKIVDLGLQLGNQMVALLVAISPEPEQKMGVLVQVHPVGSDYLPSDLQLLMLSEAGEVLQQVYSRSQDNYIQLKRFRGLPGETFKIKISFGSISTMESFVM